LKTINVLPSHRDHSDKYLHSWKLEENDYRSESEENFSDTVSWQPSASHHHTIWETTRSYNSKQLCYIPCQLLWQWS
jgi:hypothetical protein